MMPEQDSMMSWYLLSSFHYHLNDIGKVPKRKEKLEMYGCMLLGDASGATSRAPSYWLTYFLPVGNLLGFMSCLLKWAK